MNWRQLFRPRIVVTSHPLLTEKELAVAFAVSEDDIRMRALWQVLAEFEQDANSAARQSVANPGISASYNGGAEHVAMVRDRIFELQQKGFGKLPLDKN